MRLAKTSSILGLIAVLFSLPASAFTIDVYQDGSSITSMAQAEAMIDAANLVASAEHDVVNLFDGLGSDGHFDNDQSIFPGGVMSDFVVRATGLISIDEAGDWTFGAEHDDGVKVSINDIEILNYPYLTDNRDTFGTVALGAGMHNVELIFYEHLGGASIEFFSQRGTHTSFNNGFELVQSSAASVPNQSSILLLALGLGGLLATRVSKRES